MTYAVLQAVRGWTFQPAMVGGKPVASFYHLGANEPTGKPGDLLDRNRSGSLQPEEFGRGKDEVTRPRVSKHPPPRFPRSMVHPNTTGTVILDSIIDTGGFVRQPEILRSSGSHDLDASALQAVCDWTFQPAMLASKPVLAYYTLTVNFEVGRR